MRTKVALVKLAAMGDVAIACRALKEFSQRFDAALEVHWVIDQGLVGLAQALLNHPPALQGVQLRWHTVDSARLFRGSNKDKARQALALFKTISRTKPRHLLLLHRDWRYRMLLRPSFRGSILAVSRTRMPELEAYAKVLDRLAQKLQLPKITPPDQETSKSAPTKTIGLLVGGARNQKILFQEKRWPRIGELVERLLTESGDEIHLFGGPDDLPIADDLLARFSGSKRVISHVGKLNLENIPTALSRLDAFISIDSGLAHIAAAVMAAPHQRVITLFGPTDPNVWAPRASGEAQVILHYKSPACSPCYLDDGNFQPCRFDGEYFQHCMREISVDQVVTSLLTSKKKL